MEREEIFREEISTRSCMENFSAKKQAKMYFLTMIALDAFKEGIGSYGFDSLEVSKITIGSFVDVRILNDTPICFLILEMI